MHKLPKITTFYVDKGVKAEFFFHPVNMDHYLTHYLNEHGKEDEKRFHRLTFEQINRLMRTGNVLIERIYGTRHFAIAFWEHRYYYVIFHLEKRADCSQLFAVFITCYATNNKDVHHYYQNWLASIQKG